MGGEENLVQNVAQFHIQGRVGVHSQGAGWLGGGWDCGVS